MACVWSSLADLPDPRSGNARLHNLLDILTIALIASIRGAESCVDFADFARDREGLFRDFLELPGRMPSHDTFSRLFRLLDPAAFATCFDAEPPGSETPDNALPSLAAHGAIVACATCCRSLIHRLTIIQANTTMPTAPIAHTTCASSKLNGFRMIGSRSRLIGIVPNRLPTIGGGIRHARRPVQSRI